ncbi:MAG: DUF4169 family protein [Rhodobacteraceae bacterium]|nr:DUF4169 family protein [Paracoccaceae bacterium]
MTNPINLNRVRKDKARVESKTRAVTNAVKFGRSKVAKSLETARADKARRELDGHEQDR